MIENGPKKILLLVEDSPGDVRPKQEAIRDAAMSIDLSVAYDGVEALGFLEHEGIHMSARRPDLILVDLNLPKMDGREVLGRIKRDTGLREIPTIILTTSEAYAGIERRYELRGNCYMKKPKEGDAIQTSVASINEFWLMKAKLPTQGKPE